MWTHVTARLLPGSPSLVEPSRARWLWRRLREAFPAALAVALMPDHVHVVSQAPPPAARAKLRSVASGFARRRGQDEAPAPRWCPVPEPRVIADRGKLARQVRYVVLNPCRAHLVRDPLCWPWTTHRDVVGAVVDPWVDATRLATALRAGRHHFVQRHHAYVSGDPSVRVDGTPPPAPAPRSSVAVVSLDELVRAALAATRSSVGALRCSTQARQLLLCLAHAQGWQDARRLGGVCGLTPHGVRKAWARGVDDLGPALLCLGDRRLTDYLAPPLLGLQTPPLHVRGNAR